MLSNSVFSLASSTVKRNRKCWKKLRKARQNISSYCSAMLAASSVHCTVIGQKMSPLLNYMEPVPPKWTNTCSINSLSEYKISFRLQKIKGIRRSEIAIFELFLSISDTIPVVNASHKSTRNI